MARLPASPVGAAFRGRHHDNAVTPAYGRVLSHEIRAGSSRRSAGLRGAHRPELEAAPSEESKMKHRIPSSTFLLAAALCAVPAVVFAADAAPMGGATMITPDQLKWGDAPPALPKGAKLAVLHGDIAKEGLFVVRIRMPANYKIAPHMHPQAYTVTILSGKPSVGIGEKLDTKAAHALKASSFHYLPAKTNHYWLLKGPAEIEVQGAGPFGITYVNPDDNPEKMAAKK